MRVAGCVVFVLLLSGCLDRDADVRSTHLIPLNSDSYVWAHPFPGLLVEVDYVTGWAPEALAFDELSLVLQRETDKVNIEFIFDEIPRQNREAWNGNDLMAVAQTYRTFADGAEFDGVPSAVLHILLLDGRIATKGETAIGVATASAAFVMEHKADPEWEPPEARPWYQRSVLIHEVGHMLGLIGNGAPEVTPHHDDEDPVHSNNPESVMSTGSVGWGGILPYLLEKRPPPYEFDENDRADLAAFRELGRGRAPSPAWNPARS